MTYPSKLTPERHAKIVKDLADGAYAKVAALANGVNDRTYRDWMARGRDAARYEYGGAVDPADQPYVNFHDAVKEAEAKAEMLAIGRIQKAAETTWQAAAWYLERKHSDRWGRKDHLRQEISGPDGAAIQVEAEDAVMSFLDGRHERLVEAGIVEETEPSTDPTPNHPDGT